MGGIKKTTQTAAVAEQLHFEIRKARSREAHDDERAQISIRRILMEAYSFDLMLNISSCNLRSFHPQL